MPKDLTLEINPSHPTIINLNEIRKAEPEFAKEISMVFLDQVLTHSNIPYDIKEGAGRTTKIMESYLNQSLSMYKVEDKTPIITEAIIEPINEESIMSQTENLRERSQGKKIIGEYEVTGKEDIKK